MTTTTTPVAVRPGFDPEAFLDWTYAQYKLARTTRLRYADRPRSQDHVAAVARESEWAAVLAEVTGAMALDWQADPRARADVWDADQRQWVPEPERS